jgi:hypothetical protein
MISFVQQKDGIFKPFFVPTESGTAHCPAHYILVSTGGVTENFQAINNQTIKLHT